MTDAADPRLAALRGLVADLAPHLNMDLALRLWDGVPLPLGPHWTGDLAFAIRSPGALTRLVRSPRLQTLVELIAEDLVEVEGGTLLDLAARRQARGTKRLWQKLSKAKLARALLPFLFGNRGATASLAYAGAMPRQYEAGRDDKALVQFHYDLSNDFYRLFLDEQMVYSCAYFPDWDASLDEAQTAKLEHICRKLRLRPGERFLDIGCGWGGLVCHAAQHHGAIAHGVTLSQAQFDFAQAKIARLGLEGRVTIELRDFRSLAGSFDKIASVGMYEHVGLANTDGYFQHIRGLLGDGGLYLHHAITAPMKRSDRRFRRTSTEFRVLTKYIFPGGELDHIGSTTTALERNGFEVHDTENLREHYGRTCRLWTERLYANRDEAARQAGAAKTRLWLLYLAGVTLSFERNTSRIFQTLASKRVRGPSGLPPTRADIYR
jgi:cyclopropane-fatty-acyl-phospholipid synthase